MNLLLSLVYSLNTNRRKSMKQISNHNPELNSSECATGECYRGRFGVISLQKDLFSFLVGLTGSSVCSPSVNKSHLCHFSSLCAN